MNTLVHGTCFLGNVWRIYQDRTKETTGFQQSPMAKSMLFALVAALAASAVCCLCRKFGIGIGIGFRFRFGLGLGLFFLAAPFLASPAAAAGCAWCDLQSPNGAYGFGHPGSGPS